MNDFVSIVDASFQLKNVEAFIEAFPTGEQDIFVLSSEIRGETHQMEGAISRLKEGSLGDYTKEYITFVINYRNSDPMNRWLSSLNVSNSFVSMYTGADKFWLTGALKKISKMCFDLYLAVPASTEKKINATKMGEFLQRAVKVQMSDRNPLPDSKRAGIYSMINLLIHFSVDSGSMGSIVGLVANIRRSGPLLSEFPISDQVAFRYWMGRHHLLKHQVRLAKDEFEFALKHCPSWHISNKRIILEYSIVANMLRGKIPQISLLEKYGIRSRYEKLIFHLVKGNMSEFKKELLLNFSHFKKMGVYLLLLERSEIIILRNVLFRLFRINRSLSADFSVLSFQGILVAFKVSTQDLTMDYGDAECIVSNLIEQGYIKGHIQPSRSVLVVSKTMPFPSMKQIKPPIGLPY